MAAPNGIRRRFLLGTYTVYNNIIIWYNIGLTYMNVHDDGCHLHAFRCCVTLILDPLPCHTVCTLHWHLFVCTVHFFVSLDEKLTVTVSSLTAMLTNLNVGTVYVSGMTDS